MLMRDTVSIPDEREAAERCVALLQKHFRYSPDIIVHGVPEHWPTQAELLQSIDANDGVLVGDCDDHAFAAVYQMALYGHAARVVTGAVRLQNGKWGGHMVCETRSGYLIDNMWPGYVQTWEEKQRVIPHVCMFASGFFATDASEVGKWRKVLLPSDSEEAALFQQYISHPENWV